MVNQQFACVAGARRGKGRGIRAEREKRALSAGVGGGGGGVVNVICMIRIISGIPPDTLTNALLNIKTYDQRLVNTIFGGPRSKFECLVYEMLFIKERNPRLNTQSDSIRPKVCV